MNSDSGATATSHDRLISAALDADGRLDKLSLRPELFRFAGNGGMTLDSTIIAERIREVINSAYDDLVRQLAERNSGDMSMLAEDLQAAVTDLERTFGDLGSDLRRDVRRLGVDVPPPPELRDDRH